MRLRCHFHNTRNTGIANAFAAIEAGVDVLDASIGGIGGCPFAPAATGNIPTEDLLYMLGRMGVETGVDLERTIATARWLEERFGRRVPGLLTKAGALPGCEGEDVSYRLGVDVGGTFTDLLLIDEKSGKTCTPRCRRTPKDQSIGVLKGIERSAASRHRSARDRPRDARHDGRHQHRADRIRRAGRPGHHEGLPAGAADRPLLRSGRPRRLGDLQQAPPLAPLELTIEANERIGADGAVVRAARRGEAARRARETRQDAKIEALTVSLFNAYANGAHERRIREIACEVLPGIPVSISSEVMPEMYEYERTETTVVNSYVRPVVSKVRREPARRARPPREGREAAHPALRRRPRFGGVRRGCPVNLLMSGPAGGVSGALWVAKQAGFENLLTFDMGGTSTDVALIENGVRAKRRETRVGDVTVRASSIDVRTVGAGGGSIAYVPELTKALRVGPQSAGADPGPAAYGKRRRRADRHRRQRRARLPAGDAAPRRRHGDRPRARRQGGAEDRRRARHVRSRTRRRASTTSSTRTCSARSAWSRSSRATTRATSR